MKTTEVTIRIDSEMERQLDRAARMSGRSRSSFVREALRRQLVQDQLTDLRCLIKPFAGARGYLNDEDVFRDIS